MSVSKSRTPEGITVLRVEGRMVGASMDDLKTALESVPESEYVVLNLKGVHLVDSIAMGYLVRRYGMTTTRKNGGMMKLCDVHPSVQRLLLMAELDQVFSIYPREEDALKSIRGTTA